MLRLQEIERKQLLRGGGGKLHILLRRQGGHPPAGLAGDGHAYAARSDDLAHLLQQHCRVVEIDLQDRFDRGLAGRNGCGIHQHFDLTVLETLGNEILNGFPIGQIHLHRNHIKTGLIHGLCNGLCVLQFLIAYDDFHSRTHAAGNGHANLSGPSQQHHLFHRSVSLTHF